MSKTAIDTSKLSRETLEAMVQDLSDAGSVVSAGVVTLPRTAGTTRVRLSVNQPAPVRRRPASKAAPKRAKAKTGAKREPAAIDALTKRLLAHVLAHPGEGIEAIGQVLGVKTSELGVPVKRLLASKQISRSGKKRATKYGSPRAKAAKKVPAKTAAKQLNGAAAQA